MASAWANNQPSMRKSHPLLPNSNMLRGIVLFGNWHKCPSCGNNVLFLDPAFKPNDSFLCGLCVCAVQFEGPKP